jgi:hypothetical protein
MALILEWVGSVAFAICAIPTAWEALRSRTVSIHPGTLILWFVGESSMMVWSALEGHWVLLWVNYTPNFLCLCVTLWVYGSQRGSR